MSGRYLLDTNIAIRILNNELDLEARPEDESEAFLCVTVVGELFFGAERSGRPEANKARVDRLMELCPLVPHDLATARHYGAVKKRLLQQGRPIPENDIFDLICIFSEAQGCSSGSLVLVSMILACHDSKS